VPEQSPKKPAVLAFDSLTLVRQHARKMIASESQFSLTRVALIKFGRAKEQFLMNFRAPRSFGVYMLNGMAHPLFLTCSGKSCMSYHYHG
jgi:hypothetical protein